MDRDDLGSLGEAFGASLDPEALYLHGALQKVCGKLLLAQLSDRKGLFLIVGEAGTGKSVLLTKILGETRAGDCCICFAVRPNLSLQDLVADWCAELGLSGETAEGKAELTTLLSFLRAQVDAGAVSALLLDQAEHLSDEILTVLGEISGMERKKRKLVRVVLAGRPELEARLVRPELAKVKEAVAFYSRLEPLKEWEACAYIEHRLHRMGYEGPELFAPQAIVSIAHASGGVPRLINGLCGTALLTAKRQSASRVSGTLAEQAIEEHSRHLHRLSDGQPCSEPQDAASNLRVVAARTVASEAVTAASEADTAAPAVASYEWPWPITIDAVSGKMAARLYPNAPAAPPPRRRRWFGGAARSAAVFLAGLAIGAAAVSFYPLRIDDLEAPWVDWLAAFEAKLAPDDAPTVKVSAQPGE